jgi:hypothetical protein
MAAEVEFGPNQHHQNGAKTGSHRCLQPGGSADVVPSLTLGNSGG